MKNDIPKDILLLIVMLPVIFSCTATVPPATSPAGGVKTTQTQMLEKGAEILQPEGPINAISVYLDGFHFHSGNMEQQVEAHHYCTQINEDFIQCTLYSGNGSDALLMGVEYVISEKLFASLPMEERKLWHSHHYEVASGQLIAPGLPQIAEHELMEKLVSTYGKTWHTWPTDRIHERLPLGYPQLMMGFTADGQLKPEFLQKRDELFGISSQVNREARRDIPLPQLVPGANAWEQGEVLRLQLITPPPAEVVLPEDNVR